MKENQEEFFLYHHRSIAVLSLRLKECQENFFNRTEHAALLSVCRAKWFIQGRLQCLTFLICILITGWCSLGCGPCVSACGLYHCWHELLWAAFVLPSTVQTWQGWCWHGDHGVSSWSGSVGLVLFHGSFTGCLKLLSSLDGLLQGQGGCKELALGVWPLPLGRESLVRGHSPVLWEACAGCRGLLSPFCRASCQRK